MSTTQPSSDEVSEEELLEFAASATRGQCTRHSDFTPHSYEAELARFGARAVRSLRAQIAHLTADGAMPPADQLAAAARQVLRDFCAEVLSAPQKPGFNPTRQARYSIEHAERIARHARLEDHRLSVLSSIELSNQALRAAGICEACGGDLPARVDQFGSAGWTHCTACPGSCDPDGLRCMLKRGHRGDCEPCTHTMTTYVFDLRRWLAEHAPASRPSGEGSPA